MSLVATVVKNDIERSEFTVYVCKKIWIGLTAYPDKYVLRCDLVCLARLINVDADNRRVRVKVLFPHAE